jgi:hypothetical protein
VWYGEIGSGISPLCRAVSQPTSHVVRNLPTGDYPMNMFKKQRENKRANALIDATVDATQQRGQSKDSSHLAVENALLRELAET